MDTNGAAASGDFSRLPDAVPGCLHLEPGAASDVRATALTSAYSYSTQKVAQTLHFILRLVLEIS